MPEHSEPSRVTRLEAENALLRRMLDDAGIPLEAELRGLGSDLAQNRESEIVELLHQSRNTLATVRAIMRQSAATSRSAEDCARHLVGRVEALARTQRVSPCDHRAGIDLGSLIADELLVHLAREGEKLELDGPRMRLRQRAAQTLGLAIHELATNAVEHGALTRPKGRIGVRWCMEPRYGKPNLHLEWTESGMDGLATPTWRGFGTEMLEHTLGYELGARTVLAYEPDGLRCSIRVPLSPWIDAGSAALPDPT